MTAVAVGGTPGLATAAESKGTTALLYSPGREFDGHRSLHYERSIRGRGERDAGGGKWAPWAMAWQDGVEGTAGAAGHDFGYPFRRGGLGMDPVGAGSVEDGGVAAEALAHMHAEIGVEGHQDLRRRIELERFCHHRTPGNGLRYGGCSESLSCCPGIREMRIPQPLDLQAQQHECDADGDQDRNTQPQIRLPTLGALDE